MPRKIKDIAIKEKVYKGLEHLLSDASGGNLLERFFNGALIFLKNSGILPENYFTNFQ